MNTMFRDFGFPSGGLLGITDGHRQQRHQQPFNQLAPTSMFDFGFSNMFQNMRRMMDDMHNTFVSCMILHSFKICIFLMAKNKSR